MPGTLVAYPDALTTVLANAQTLGTDRVSAAQLNGRVLSEDISTVFDIPSFDSSSVDGFALTGADCNRENVQLTLVGAVRAGSAPMIALAAGETARVMTGAMLPLGTVAVAMQEDAEVCDNSVSLGASTQNEENIRRRAEVYGAGATLVRARTLCTPPVVSLAASSGHANFSVFRRPTVAILTTGDELAPPGSDLLPGQIYASNGFGLTAAVLALGLEEPCVLHVGDVARRTEKAIGELLKRCDVLLTSGGVSVGAHDHVKAALAANDVIQTLWGVAIKPGRPFYFGIRDRQLVFGLPGNPVSALVCFRLFVRPALRSMLGMTAEPTAHARLTDSIQKAPGRAEFVRGVQDGGDITPIASRGSHMMDGLVAANCFIHCKAEASALPEGADVEVIPLKWDLE